jgi:S-adenosylmethionine-diacylglycerol 3-amino-3-carboxypropyl transferase
MKRIQDWTARRLFEYVHGNHLVYNSCWEDPRLDREVMKLGSDDEVVLITSAGCNALDYALDGPRKIHAVDLNFRQNALLELKLAGIRELEFEQFFSLFGDGGNPAFPQWYQARLRRHLSPSASRYWDRRQRFLSRPTPDSSFYHCGATGYFARMMGRYFRFAGVQEDIARLFEARTLAQQTEIYNRRVRTTLWRPLVKRALRTDATLSLLGVPTAQREHLERTCGQTIADFMEDCVETVLTRLPVHDNYFWRLYVFGRYSRDCCPGYLQQENFERLKGGLADRVEVHTESLTSFLQSHPGGLTRLVLLDHMDWLSHRYPAALAEEWQAIMDRAREGALILWRSGGFEVDFVDPIQVQHRGQSRRVGDLLRYDREQAAQCHARDRVHTYGSFHIAQLVG